METLLEENDMVIRLISDHWDAGEHEQGKV